MNTIQSILIALLQGATELFPVSSLGHAVILPALLRWQTTSARPFLPFLVMLHLGTAAALLLYFWRDWWTFATRRLRPRHRAHRCRRPARLRADRRRDHPRR